MAAFNSATLIAYHAWQHVIRFICTGWRKKEDALIRIFDIAEKELVRGTHPELEEKLRSVDGTIEALIKQINGIVAGQDSKIDELKAKLNKAIEAKDFADEVSKKASARVEEAIKERDKARQERDDARSIAAEKSRSNDLLFKQVNDMTSDLDGYKSLRASYEDLKEQSIRAEFEKERAVMNKEREMIAEKTRLEMKIEQLREEIASLQK